MSLHLAATVMCAALHVGKARPERVRPLLVAIVPAEAHPEMEAILRRYQDMGIWTTDGHLCIDGHTEKERDVGKIVLAWTMAIMCGAGEIVRISGRCAVTGNPCGTDTWSKGHACPCPACGAYLKAAGGAVPRVRRAARGQARTGRDDPMRMRGRFARSGRDDSRDSSGAAGSDEVLMTFEEVVLHCFDHDEFMHQYRRLMGSTLGAGRRPRTALDVLIDEATGHDPLSVDAKEATAFFEFVYTYIWEPLVREACAARAGMKEGQ